MNKKLWITALTIITAVSYTSAKVDLATLPTRDKAQLTIYNSADMTLVRDSRQLTLKNGINRLEFSWANTLIDPTSLEMRAIVNVDKIDILDLNYPPRVQNLGVWNIKSKISGKVPVEITYLTSGLSWRAFYIGTLSGDEKVMKLEGYIVVSNNSGEDYENAQVRLIVGKVHMLDEIATLARRRYPYETPLEIVDGYGDAKRGKREEILGAAEKFAVPAVRLRRPKGIVKEGLSEYFLYTIEGTETIPNGWSKRLSSFIANNVPVVNLYKYEEEQWGSAVVRMLSFKNDKAHNLGDTPIPDGTLKVYRLVDKEQHLSYEGESSFKYIPVNEKVELNLGIVQKVIVKPTLMDFKTDNYLFGKSGNIEGWDEIREFRIEVKNTRNIPCKVEIVRNFPTRYWSLEKSGDFWEYEKVDIDTVKFTLQVAPRSNKEFSYKLTTRHGTRAE